MMKSTTGIPCLLTKGSVWVATAALAAGCALLFAWMQAAAAMNQPVAIIQPAAITQPESAAAIRTEAPLGKDVILLAHSCANRAGVAEQAQGSAQGQAAPVEQAAPMEQAALFDLAMHKFQYPCTFTVGEGNLYILEVERTNTGVIPQGVTVEDMLPVGMSWKPGSQGNWDCSPSTPKRVSCSYLESNPEVFEPLVVPVTIDTGSVLTTSLNTALLLVTDAITTNNVSSITTVMKDVDLGIRMSYSPKQVNSSLTPLTFTLVVSNTGPDTARNVIVSETLPAELLAPLVVVEKSPGSSTFDSASHTWSIGALPEGGEARLVLSTQPLEAANGLAITSTARVRSDNPDYDPANDAARTVMWVAGVEFKETVSRNTALAGEGVDFQFTVKNLASKRTSYLYLQDSFTNTFEVLICQGRQSDVSNLGTCYFNGPWLDYYVAGLDPGQSFTVTAVVRSSDSITKETVINNTSFLDMGYRLYLDYGYLQSNPVSLAISPPHGLLVTQSDRTTYVQLGQVVSYTVAIANIGSLATGAGTLRFSETFLANVSFLRIEAGGLDMEEILTMTTAAQRTWRFPTQVLAPGSLVTFTIFGQVSAMAQPDDEAWVQGVASALDTAAEQVRGVGSHKDLFGGPPIYSVDVAASPYLVFVGQPVTFRILIKSNRSYPTSILTIKDRLPSQVDFISTSQGSYDSASRTVSFYRTTVQPNEVIEILIRGRLNDLVVLPHLIDNYVSAYWGVYSQSIHVSEASFLGVPYDFLKHVYLDLVWR
jgi:hypothetical protein